MAIVQAFTGAIGGTFADQWKDIIAPGPFEEHSVVVPGVLQQDNNGRGANTQASHGVITNGSKIFVPENTAAIIFSQGGIEEIITVPGGYEYTSGQASVLNRDSPKLAIVKEIATRVAYAGQPSDQKLVAFVNLREIRGIKFGTRGPVVYNDSFYGTDLEVTAFGTFSVRVIDAANFVQSFVPPNVYYYSMTSPQARQQLLSEFVQSFVVALNSLSAEYRVSQLPAQAQAIAAAITADGSVAATWRSRFGLEVVQVGVENIEFTPASKELVNQYSSNRMNVRAYEGVSQETSNISAQQKIAQGVQEHGLGEGGGLLFGMNLAQGMNPQNAATAPDARPATAMTVAEQVEAVKKVKELHDAGILTDEEFAAKKKEIMGL
jgi:membrane protease subunit (stomatin/prohibitin family)